MSRLKIAILGSRGIPNHYGGFEQLAQFLSQGLVEKGWDVTVYNSHRHPYKEKKWNEVSIVHCYDAEHWMGTAGQFIYDLNCIRHARKQGCDIVLFLGYTSSSIWRRWFPKKSIIISNMDGLEWKRSKYSGIVKRFLAHAEKLAVRYSDHLIGDSPVIRDYLKDKYQVDSCFIPYGAEQVAPLNEERLSMFNLTANEYFMLMARMEPENNIDMILDGFCRSKTENKFLVIGNADNSYGKKMKEKYSADKRIVFAGAIYDPESVHLLRMYCSLYFHGHSVGGTNPSLLEAMADKAPIVAHDNPFNRAVLQQDAAYFRSTEEVLSIINDPLIPEQETKMVENNLSKINSKYNWPMIINEYHQFLNSCLTQQKA